MRTSVNVTSFMSVSFLPVSRSPASSPVACSSILFRFCSFGSLNNCVHLAMCQARAKHVAALVVAFSGVSVVDRSRANLSVSLSHTQLQVEKVLSLSLFELVVAWHNPIFHTPALFLRHARSLNLAVRWTGGRALR